MLLGWQRISSWFYLRKVEEYENSREIVKRKEVEVFWGDLVERSA